MNIGFQININRIVASKVKLKPTSKSKQRSSDRKKIIKREKKLRKEHGPYFETSLVWMGKEAIKQTELQDLC